MVILVLLSYRRLSYKKACISSFTPSSLCKINLYILCIDTRLFYKNGESFYRGSIFLNFFQKWASSILSTFFIETSVFWGIWKGQTANRYSLVLNKRPPRLLILRSFSHPRTLFGPPRLLICGNFCFSNYKIFKSILSIRGILTDFSVPELYCRRKRTNKLKYRHKEHNLIPYL